ncbi:FecR domain-containing protein [Blastopirellula marina]|uniref:FecR protein domain-containing protein n=1 Tax=Blastopirellula marina TaxID=124 RepID=A0A2S8F9G7_9BACT|nr:FecR domain-containing protein [Blastopirellula marina]PQO28801.1 hypothetical protein C5Y98_23780 [Blastopirellula marina]
MTREFNKRLGELAHRSVHDSLTADEHAELEQMLLASSDAREAYLLLLDLEYGLAKLAAEETGRQTLTLPEAVLPSRVTRGERTVSQPSRSNYLPLIALTLLGFLAIAWFVWHGSSSQIAQEATSPTATPNEASPNANLPEEPEMRIVQLARSRFFGEPQAFVPGNILDLHHDYALVEGCVQLRSRTGAEMIVQAPAVFNVQSAEQVLLKMGTCSVYAPDGAEGFQVSTPKAVVVDKGTRFSIRVNETGEADVEVIEGAAELFAVDEMAQPKADSLMLAAGEGRVVNSLGEITTGNANQFGNTYRAALPDRIIDFDATGPSDPEPDQLLGVTVQRGGKTYQYDVDQLIGFDLIHFKAGRNSQNLTTPIKQTDPMEGDGSRTRAHLLDQDHSLATGLLNPGGSSKPLVSDPDMTNADLDQRTPGIGIRFHQPVVNNPGPDILFFDLQVVVHPEAGDPFFVSPTHFQPGLHSHAVLRYDISLADRQAHLLSGFRLYGFRQPIRSVEELLTAKHNGGVAHAAPAKIIAVGIDLSDLGYPLGAEVDELFFQDMLDDENLIDPVFLGGLPPTSTTSSSLEK